MAKKNKPTPPAKPKRAKPARTAAAVVPENPNMRLARVNNEIRAFMIAVHPDLDRDLRELLMTMHIFAYWDKQHGSPVARFMADRELELLTLRAAGLPVIGR